MEDHASVRTSSVRATVVAIAIVTAALVWQSIGAWQDSQTADEAAHLGAGISYWQSGQFRMNPEHPPLMKLLAALPVITLTAVQTDERSTAWQSYNEWQFGADLVYGTPPATATSARWVLFLGRLPMILIWASLGLLVFWWAGRRGHPWAGVLALGVYAFDPNFLGHGHLITTDVGAALFFTAVVLAGARFFTQPTWTRLAWLTLWFALAQVTKFSSLILWLIVPVVGLLVRWRFPELLSWRWWWRLIAGLLVVSAVVTWTVYGFEIKRIDSDPRVARLWTERRALLSASTDEPLAWLAHWTARPTVDRALREVGTWSMPAYSFWRGASAVISHNYWGHAAYLLGQTSSRGWWYYFPVAFAVKTPIITLGLLLLAGGLVVRRRRLARAATGQWLNIHDLTIVTPVALYIVWSLTSHINIGLRHLFPIYPFVALAIATLAENIARRPPWARVGLAAAGVGLALTAVMAGSNTIGYFNAFAGGTNRGQRYLLDSNLDWGQDVWRLSDWLQTHRRTAVSMSLFGTMPYRRFFPDASSPLTDADIAAGRRPTGAIIMSLGRLEDRHAPYRWLRSYRPSWRVGSSIVGFDFR